MEKGAVAAGGASRVGVALQALAAGPLRIPVEADYRAEMSVDSCSSS